MIVTSTTEEKDKEKTIQKDTTDSTTQNQGAPLIPIIDQGSSDEYKEEEKTPKEREQEAIQMLVNLPTARTTIK